MVLAIGATAAGAALVAAAGFSVSRRREPRNRRRGFQGDSDSAAQLTITTTGERSSGALQRASWLRQASQESGPGAESRPHVVLIATGSVAGVKVPALVVELCNKLAAEVAVVLTGPGEIMAGRVANAYCSEDTMREMDDLRHAGRVHVLRDNDEWDGYKEVSEDMVVHIELRKWADLALVAPCSANSLAKIACGLCDNLATSLLRAWDPEKPLIVAPAMNTVMWEHPITNQHLRTLESWGFLIIPPASKKLACGDVGRGALAPVDEIVEVAQGSLRMRRPRHVAETPGVGAWRRLGFEEWAPRRNDIYDRGDRN